MKTNNEKEVQSKEAAAKLAWAKAVVAWAPRTMWAANAPEWQREVMEARLETSRVCPSR